MAEAEEVTEEELEVQRLEAALDESKGWPKGSMLADDGARDTRAADVGRREADLERREAEVHRREAAVLAELAALAVELDDALKRRAASVLGQFVVLYPAINVVATYPLNAITFGDALMATYREKCGAWEDRPSDLPPSASQTRFFRLVAGVPPLVGAALVDDISAITGVTGCFGLAMCAVLPGVLAIRGQRVAPGPAPHATRLNGFNAAAGLAICGSLLTLSALGAALKVPGLA